MQRLVVRPYTDADAQRWDELVERSINGTFLHTRRFLSYHGTRFTDRSAMLCDDNGRVAAVFPAALDPQDAGTVVSHPGSTYGGLVHDGKLNAVGCLMALQALREHYAHTGLKQLVYKAVPNIYHRLPAQDDLYALFRMAAEVVRRDLSCAVDLSGPQRTGERRRRSLKRAETAGVSVEWGAARLPEFWDLLTSNLAARHRVAPVHSLSEIELLVSRFPGAIEIVLGIHEGCVAAGTVLFNSPSVSHTQYMAASTRGREVAALDLVLHAAIHRASEDGRRFVDFGISTERAGLELNEGLHTFKAEFGGGGVVHEFFRLVLD